jgi:hypothetical protein
MRSGGLLPVVAFAFLANPALATHSSGHSHSHKSKSNSSSPSTKSSKKCTTCARDSHGKIKRSEKAKGDFRHAHPCPGGPDHGSTTKCSGYVIDHVKPLECGGAPTLRATCSGRRQPRRR